MRRTNKIISVVLILAILLLGIGYAAIQNITLNITGTAAADPSQSNYKVKFTGTPTVSDEVYVTTTIIDDTNATINVDGLTKAGDIVSATYTVQNVSTDLSADLSVSTTNSNTEYFTLTSELEKTSIEAGETTMLTVSVELTKTPTTDRVTASIGIQLEAFPVQPGQEGTSEEINGSSQTPETTIDEITNVNIGDFIDLGIDVVGTTSTSDDWRILYKDEENVYAILADFLPNSTNYASNAGLNILGTYGVYSNDSREIFINKLMTNDNWNDLANGISGATVTGGPSASIVRDSYYVKSGVYLDISMETGLMPQMDSNVQDYDLYIPHNKVIDDCEGSWTMSQAAPHMIPAWIWGLKYDGMFNATNCDNASYGLRPVVTLPFNTEVRHVGDVWIVNENATNGKTIAGEERENEVEDILTTLATVTNENIGEYIDLGNNFVGGETTSDDWRILYKDGDIIYAILSNVLPITLLSDETELITDQENYPYSVWSTTSGATLVNGLENEATWSWLTNGIEGATVTGGPTAELLMSSYNFKYESNVKYTDYPWLEASYLYAPVISNGCMGYWLKTQYTGIGDFVWGVSNIGTVGTNDYNITSMGVRPVVALPSDIICTYIDGIWVVN